METGDLLKSWVQAIKEKATAGGWFRAPCRMRGPAAPPGESRTRPSCSAECASASLLERCVAVSSPSPATRTLCGSRKDLGTTKERENLWPRRRGLGGHCNAPPPRPTLGDEILLKLLQELQVEQVLRGERLLPHHCFHGLHVLPDGVAGVLWKDRGQDSVGSPPL